MELTAAEKEANLWSGGQRPLNASYGKLMMWFFIVSDALTFSGFLVSYGFSRFKNIDSWPIADEVFTHFPFLHGIDAPMYYVALMTFILIFSSLTALGFSLPSLIKKSKNLSTEIPFGPHMVIGCILYVVLIDEIFKFLI